MRKFILGAGLILGAAMIFGSVPAKADLGCLCVKLGQNAACVSGIASCIAGPGACVLPCDYTPSKKMMRHGKKKKK